MLITRSRDDAEPLVAALMGRGVNVLVAPLLEIEYLQGPHLDLAGVQALLATSANGVRAFAARDQRRHLPVFAVGDATARTAVTAGFAAVESASGDVVSLAELIGRRLAPRAGTLLHIAGTDLAGDLGGMLRSAGYAYRRAVLYRAHTADALPLAATEAIGGGSVHGVVLFSPRTAAAFVALIRKGGLVAACRALNAFCLSPAVAQQVGGIGWGRITIATRPDQTAMIDAVAAAKK